MIIEGNDNAKSRLTRASDSSFPLFEMKKGNVKGIIAEETYFSGYPSEENFQVIYNIYNYKYKHKYVIGFSDYRIIENKISEYKKLKLWGRVGLKNDIVYQSIDEVADINDQGILYRGMCKLRLIDSDVAKILLSSRNFLILGVDELLDLKNVEFISSSMSDNINMFSRNLNSDIITLFIDDSRQEFGGIAYRSMDKQKSTA